MFRLQTTEVLAGLDRVDILAFTADELWYPAGKRERVQEGPRVMLRPNSLRRLWTAASTVLTWRLSFTRQGNGNCGCCRISGADRSDFAETRWLLTCLPDLMS